MLFVFEVEMSRFIANDSEIDSLGSINGISIAQIEARSVPIDDNTSDPHEWKYRSFDGFLNEGESLKTRYNNFVSSLRSL